MAELKDLKEFNAKIGLEGFDATESRPMGNGKNLLEIDKEYIFKDLEKTASWAGKEQPLVITDNGIECHAPYIASCMIAEEGVILNEDKGEVLKCMHTPRTVKAAGLKFKHVQKYVTDDNPKFPKLKVVDTLPIALKRVDLIKNAKESTKALYQQKLGTTLDKLDVEYVPSYRKSDWANNNDGLFSIKSSIVEIV